MGFWDKFKTVAQPVAQITGAVAPGTAGDIARIVERAINNERDPQNLGALRQLADEIVKLQIRVKNLENISALRPNK